MGGSNKATDRSVKVAKRHPSASLTCLREPSPAARRAGYQSLLGPVFTLLVLAAASAAAQEDAPGIDPRYVFNDTIAVRWVLIPTVVLQGTQLADGLDVRDFNLRVDGRPVAIETFENRLDAPVSVVYLQDLSGSMALREKIEASQETLARFMKAMGTQDEVSLVTFTGEKVTVAAPFTARLEDLQTLSHDWTAHGTTALYDAVTWLPEVSLDGSRTRRAAVVITDGQDNASVIHPEDAERHVRSTELPVYVIDLSRFNPSGAPPPASDKPLGVLELLAKGTGGRYYRPRTPTQLALVTAEIARELRRQYVLGFAADSSRASSSHSVEIEVRGRKRQPRHRPRYFGPPPAGAPD